MRDAYDIVLGPLVTEKLGRLAEAEARAVEKRKAVAARRKARAEKTGAGAKGTAAADAVDEARSVVAFKVRRDANKIEIRRAIEEIFKEKKLQVESVRTMNYRGKLKRMGRFQGRRPDWKKAIVTLAPGQSIPELT